MALYSGISVMMTLLAFATLIGLAQARLKCYYCSHDSSIPGGNNDIHTNNCRESNKFGDLREVNLPSEVCIKIHGSNTKKGKSNYMERRHAGYVGIGFNPPVGVCKEEIMKDGPEPGTYTICCCNDKDGCNGKVGLGPDVNVILGFGVIALVLVYLRQ